MLSNLILWAGVGVALYGVLALVLGVRAIARGDKKPKGTRVEDLGGALGLAGAVGFRDRE